MKRVTFIFLCLLAGIATSLPAQQKENTADQSLLWKISGKDLVKPSYIFGTLHEICPHYMWTSLMQESLEKSDKVCFEIDNNDPILKRDIAVGMLDRNGKVLKDYFTPQQYQKLSNYLKDRLKMDIYWFEHAKPVMLADAISLSLATICPNPESYEKTIAKAAQGANKPIIGLEDAREQIDAMQSVADNAAIKEVLEHIGNNGKKHDSLCRRLMDAYRAQDLPAVHKMLKNPQLRGELGEWADERNKKWVPRMEEDMHQSSVFFALGAGHLFGDGGLIKLLRKSGYTVEPVK
jgi:uncharacterized protein